MATALFRTDGYRTDEIPPALQSVASQWLRQIERAKKFKNDVFARDAAECMSYYAGPKSWDEMMGVKEIMPKYVPELTMRMHVNKAFEFVTIFGPSMYYTNPVRTVKPKAPVQVPADFFPDPNQFVALAQAEQQRVAVDGLRSILLEAYLNWTPSRYKLDVESRLAVDEALIKGRGLLYTELTESPDRAFRAVVSRWDSVDHLVIDPDADSLDSAKWVARWSLQPAWQVERDYGLRRGTLKGNMESQAVQADVTTDPVAQYRRSRGYTSDLVYFWQLWSKMGIGGRLPGIKQGLRDSLDEVFGDYAYLVLTDCARFPLNLPPDLVNDDEAYDRVVGAAAWPIPFWSCGRWPFVPLDFHEIFNSPWPMPHLMSARGEMRFLNWVMSFLAGHLKNAGRDFVAVQKSLPESIKTALISGADLTILELERDHGVISDCIQFLQHPEVNGDFWRYMEAVEASFDKRVGLSEVLYGPDPDATQPRSAAESNIRNQAGGIRPDDMSRMVEAWQAEVAEQEAFASRYLLSGRDVAVCVGPLGAVAWDQFVFATDTRVAMHELEYRIEAGSTRRPNKDYEVRQMTEAITALLPTFTEYAQQTGDVRPMNNLIADYCKSRDLDPGRYQLMTAPQPPLLPSAAPANPTPQGDVQIPPASGRPELG